MPRPPKKYSGGKKTKKASGTISRSHKVKKTGKKKSFKKNKSGNNKISTTHMSNVRKTGYQTRKTRPRTYGFSHSEYIQDIVSSATANAVSASSFAVNPGLETIQGNASGGAFDWLCPIANSFTEYQYMTNEYEIRSLCGDNVASANNSLGAIVMAFEYNASRAQALVATNSLPFPNKSCMENSFACASGKPSENFSMKVDCRKADTPYKWYFVRDDALTSGQDYKDYDLGWLQVLTQGQPGTSVVLAELWNHYKIKFRIPYFNNVGAISAIPFAHYYSTTFTSALPLGTSGTSSVPSGAVKIYDNIGLVINTNAIVNNIQGVQQAIVFPPGTVGNYFIIVNWSNNHQAQVITPLITYSSNVTCNPIFCSNGCNAGTGLGVSGNGFDNIIGASLTGGAPNAVTTTIPIANNGKGTGTSNVLGTTSAYQGGITMVIAVLLTANSSGTPPTINFGVGGNLDSAPIMMDLVVTAYLSGQLN